MTDKPYDPKKLTDVACNFYHAIIGQKPDEAVRDRIGAGIEGVIQLYNSNPQLLYAFADAAVPLVDHYFETKFGYNGGAEGKRFADSMFESLKKLFEKEGGQ